MLRLPSFELHVPRSLENALSILNNTPQCRVVAGGTDLLPNMKHEIVVPENLVSLRHLDLSGIQDNGTHVRIGATTPVQSVADSPLVKKFFPGLAEACAQIAGPQLRRMGTIGGNICLDTRCLYINQTYFWRQSLGFCLKKDGTVCHVVAGGKNCVAAASNDSALPLILYEAELTLQSGRGDRRVAIGDFYTADGVKNTIIDDGEILTDITIKKPEPSVQVVFEKLRMRKAIDFALLNLAVKVDSDVSGLRGVDVVVGCLGSKPKSLNFDSLVKGRILDSELVDQLAKKSFASCRPLTNIASDPDWRRAMIPVLTRRALRRCRKG